MQRLTYYLIIKITSMVNVVSVGFSPFTHALDCSYNCVRDHRGINTTSKLMTMNGQLGARTSVYTVTAEAFANLSEKALPLRIRSFVPSLTVICTNSLPVVYTV